MICSEPLAGLPCIKSVKWVRGDFPAGLELESALGVKFALSRAHPG